MCLCVSLLGEVGFGPMGLMGGFFRNLASLKQKELLYTQIRTHSWSTYTHSTHTHCIDTPLVCSSYCPYITPRVPFNLMIASVSSAQDSEDG